MQRYLYHTTDEDVLKTIDAEFHVVTVIGFPEDGYSSGYDLAIFDKRSKSEIKMAIRKVYREI